MMALLPLSARADFDSAVQAYQRQQYDIAYKEFSQLAAQGDNHAKSYEAMMTLRGQGTKVNVEVGAQLARECAAGGEPTCYAMFAQLNLPGHGLQVNLPQARLWTRKAIAGGDLRAGFLLWQAYQLDPANQYLVNGQVDRQRYQQLGRRSVAQRAEQSEAIDALAAAAASGYDPARLSLAALLIEKNGASSMHQVGVLLADLPDLPGQLPEVPGFGATNRGTWPDPCFAHADCHRPAGRECGTGERRQPHQQDQRQRMQGFPPARHQQCQHAAQCHLAATEAATGGRQLSPQRYLARTMASPFLR